MSVVGEHDRLVRQLALAAERRDADLADIDRSYLDGMAALDSAAAATVTAVDRAVTGVATGRAGLAAVDAEAERIWRALRGQLGWRGRRLGGPPEPATPTSADPELAIPKSAGRASAIPASAIPELATAGPGRSTVELSAAWLLARATARVAGAARPAARGQLPRGALLWCPLLGAAAAAAVGLVAGGLAALAEAGLSALAALGWATFLLAPFAGLPLVHTWAVRRHRARLDGGAVGLTVLGGMAACCALIVALR